MVDRVLFPVREAVLLVTSGHIADVRVRAAIQDDVLRTLGIMQRTSRSRRGDPSVLAQRWGGSPSPGRPPPRDRDQDECAD
jgi:hypothetical protein